MKSLSSENLTQNCGCVIQTYRIIGQTICSSPQTLDNLGEGRVCSKSRTDNSYYDDCNANCCL